MARENAQRVPPHNDEAEIAVLGSILLEPKAMLPVVNVLEPEHFYRATHQAIYRAMQGLWRDRRPVDLIALKAALREQGAGDIAGDSELFLRLGSQVPSVANADYYAKMVRDKALLRSIIEVCGAAMQRAYDNGCDPATIVRDTQSALLSASMASSRSEPTSVRTIMEHVVGEIVDGVSPRPAIPTGWQEIDHVMAGGLRGGEFVVIGGRPSTGKSSFAVNLFRNLIRDGTGTLLLSLEVPRDQVIRNVLAATSGVDTQRLLDGSRLNKAQLAAVRDACRTIHGAPGAIDDGTDLSPSLLRAKAQWYALAHPLRVIILDYLQLMRGDGGRGRNWSRLQELTEITRDLKILARDLDVCLVACCQLSREAARDTKPKLYHLRESGTIEQDADAVFLLNDAPPDAAEDQEDDGGPARIDVIIAKQRHGPTRTIKMLFERSTLRFVPFSRYEPPGDVDAGADVLQVSEGGT